MSGRNEKISLICRVAQKTAARFELFPAGCNGGPAGRYKVYRDRRVLKKAGGPAYYGLAEALDMVGDEAARALGLTPPQADAAPNLARGDRVRVPTGNLAPDGRPMMAKVFVLLEPHQEIDGRWYVIVRDVWGPRKVPAEDVIKEQ